MNNKTVVIAALLSLCATTTVKAADAPVYFGTALCAYPEFECVKVSGGQSWEKLFPDEQQRDIVQRLNRTYNPIWSAKTIVVPKNLAKATLLDFSPFPLKINPSEKQVIVDQEKLAWGAYDADGNLVKWGPIASGSDKCSDNSSPTCRTMTGIFRVFSKEDSRCRSDVFPVGKGGAKMPYCMYFHKGFAMHGSDDMPGYRASHGCVRMFTRDAQWLNLQFVDVSNDRNGFLGTKVVVRALPPLGTKK